MQIVLLATSLVLSLPAYAGRLERQMDRFAEEAFPADGPGATIIVVKNGEVLLREAYGLADLELAVPMEPEHVLRVGSITKQFTAAGILLLAQQGKLAVDDPITRFLPDYPTHGHTLTVRHLLNHTSGVYDYTDDWEYMSGSGIRRDLSTDELIGVFSHQPMRFAPGSAHEYSNSGYVLLGAVIESASGQPWHAFLAENIFEPLAMSHTLAEPTDALVLGHARGYQQDRDGWRNGSFLSMSQPHAAGALVSTVDDLAKWHAALDADDLLSPESKAAMWTGHAVGDAIEPYGFGWDLGFARGRPSQAHRGGVSGFSAKVVRVPTEGLFVAVLSNQEDPDHTEHVADGIAAIAIGDPYPVFAPVELDPSELAAFAGFYRIAEGDERMVRVTDGGLTTVRGGGRAMRALAHGPDAFHYPGTFTWFDFVVEDGQITAMRMHDGDSGPSVSSRVRGLPVAIELPVDVLERYVGVYELRPAYALTVTLDGTRLLVQGTGSSASPISASSPTEFFTPELDAVIRFAVDGSKLVLIENGQEYPAPRAD